MDQDRAPRREDGEDDPRREESAAGKPARARERARSHPVRAAILALLSRYADGRAAPTTREVAEQLPEFEDGARPLSAVAYHLRVLAGVGLVTASDNPDAPDGRLEKVWALA